MSILFNQFNIRRFVKKIENENEFFQNVHLNSSIFYGSSPYFQIDINKDISELVSFPLKPLVPDFIVENFSQMPDGNKDSILNFINIFISRILLKNYRLSDHIYLMNYMHVRFKTLGKKKFKNKQDLSCFFGIFFHHPIEVIENVICTVNNNNKFILGKSKIYSEEGYGKPCGLTVKIHLSTVRVKVLIKRSELIYLNFLCKYFSLNQNLLLSSRNKEAENKPPLEVNFLFTQGVCKQIYTSAPQS